MHLVPPGRSTDRIIEDERVCDAIGGIGDPASVAGEAARFALLGDPQLQGDGVFKLSESNSIVRAASSPWAP